jgi:hypothetical protein
MQPSLSARQGRLLVRWLVIVSIVAVSAAVFALPAAADSPTKSEYPLHLSGVLTDVCSFPINVDSQISITEIDFFDKSGALTRITQHQVAHDTYTANGKTLVGIPYTFNFEIVFDSSGNVMHVYSDGVMEKVPLPDGGLFIAAGRFDFLAHPDAWFPLSPDKGTSGNVAGFCAALAP